MLEHLFLVLTAIFSQVGARQLVFQWTDVQKRLIQHRVTQGIILFAMFFMATRNLIWALGILFVYYFIILVLTNESHPWNMLPKEWLKEQGFFGEHVRAPTELYYENIARLT